MSYAYNKRKKARKRAQLEELKTISEEFYNLRVTARKLIRSGRASLFQFVKTKSGSLLWNGKYKDKKTGAQTRVKGHLKQRALVRPISQLIELARKDS